MLATVNKELVSFLFRGIIPTQQAPDEVREARPQPRTDMKNMRMSKPEMVSESGMPMDDMDTREPQKQMPVKVDPKIGRNDPCPCGSGKKYKACHGAGLA